MRTKPVRAVELQRKYYTDTASRYDSMHAQEGATDPGVTSFFHAFLGMLQVRAVLDVGTATGRGMANLKRALPDLFVCGVEPVAALIKKGALDGNTVAVPIVCATGEALPFPAESFDVVCDFATLHHAAHRDAIVTEGDGLAIPTASSWTFWPRGRTASY